MGPHVGVRRLADYAQRRGERGEVRRGARELDHRGQAVLLRDVAPPPGCNPGVAAKSVGGDGPPRDRRRVDPLQPQVGELVAARAATPRATLPAPAPGSQMSCRTTAADTGVRPRSPSRRRAAGSVSVRRKSASSGAPSSTYWMPARAQPASEPRNPAARDVFWCIASSIRPGGGRPARRRRAPAWPRRGVARSVRLLSTAVLYRLRTQSRYGPAGLGSAWPGVPIARVAALAREVELGPGREQRVDVPRIHGVEDHDARVAEVPRRRGPRVPILGEELLDGVRMEVYAGQLRARLWRGEPAGPRRAAGSPTPRASPRGAAAGSSRRPSGAGSPRPPSGVTSVTTASQTASAAGSIIVRIRSSTVAAGRGSTGRGPAQAARPLARAASATRTPALGRRAFRMRGARAGSGRMANLTSLRPLSHPAGVPVCWRGRHGAEGAPVRPAAGRGRGPGSARGSGAVEAQGRLPGRLRPPDVARHRLQPLPVLGPRPHRRVGIDGRQRPALPGAGRRHVVALDHHRHRRHRRRRPAAHPRP